jgi:hypothetical protein
VAALSLLGNTSAIPTTGDAFALRIVKQRQTVLSVCSRPGSRTDRIKEQESLPGTAIAAQSARETAAQFSVGQRFDAGDSKLLIGQPDFLVTRTWCAIQLLPG